MSEKLMQQKKVVFGDVTYTLQMVSASWYLDAVDSCKDENGNMKSGEYMKAVLSNVVVSPRCSVDDFTGSIYVLRNLVKECEKFVMGEELKVKEDTSKNVVQPDDNVYVQSGFSGV